MTMTLALLDMTSTLFCSNSTILFLTISIETCRAPYSFYAGATYQEILPTPNDPIIELRFNHKDDEASQEEPPHEYQTLTQVGSRNGIKHHTQQQSPPAATGGEQYAQLMRSGNNYITQSLV